MMEDLADGIKTKSLTNALELLTEQVLEISSLTTKDLEEKPHLRQSLEHLSDGIRLSTQQLCDLLARKLKNLNPSINTFETFKEMLMTAEEAATYSLWLTADETSLETFQEKIAGLLEVLLRIFVFWDQQLIKSFQHSINYLKEPLYNMRNTQFLHEILSLYKEFIIRFGSFSEKLSHRIQDLLDHKLQNEFWIHLNCIRKLVTSFAEVIKNIACYPWSKHSKISKEFVVKELVSLLDEISELLGLEQSAEDIRDGTSFLGAIDDVLEQLECSHFEDEEMGWRMNLILQHAMTVSKFSCEEDRIQITLHSQRVLNEYRSLQSLLHNLENSPSDISLAVDIFRDFLELMEQSVNHSLLRMMVENLSICTEPIRRLIHQCPIKNNELDSSRDTSDLAAEVEEFDNVMERVLQTCFFALSSTADLPKIQVIRCALKLLESLEAEMVPAIYSCYLDPTNKAASCHLQFLWRSFQEHCTHMQTSLDSIADPIAFCHVAEKVLNNHITELRKNVYVQDVVLLERHCRPIVLITTRCLAIVEGQNWDDATKAKIYLKEVHLALREFRGAALLAVGNVSDLSGHRSMLKRAELVLKYLMKCIDSMKQMQESELHLTVQETLRNEIKGTPSIMLFPDDVIDLPCDPVKSVRGTTLLYNPNSTRIGRLPKRKILHSNYCQETSEQDVSEMSRFIDTKQTWRTRCTTIPTREESILDMEVKHEISNISESFDLTNLLEELSTLEGTLKSTQSSQIFAVESQEQFTPSDTQSKATPLSVSISTPQRLRDLQIVSERLALLRKQNFNA
ncbi:uncharacterized protein LOC124327034 [Daphnia pulicaria]|uniref:uncharacterized protein LOC124327034 n=1 Tax=Daphnia pulicaria TaxID=35523 RepID=UPI001EEAA719|nr:uncharacterized protein LOC124327034 [Daphnia pulicaria]